MSTIKLEPGMLVKTSYGEQIYRIVSIHRGCTCPDYLDTINLDDSPDRPPHIHITCSNPDSNRAQYFLEAENEETLRSLEKSYCNSDKLEYDYITILEQDKPIQSTFHLT